jgi:hypothetical protein
MTYYVYFDSYGQAKGAVSERELAEKYGNDPSRFLRAMCGLAWNAGIERTSGHVVSTSVSQIPGPTTSEKSICCL